MLLAELLRGGQSDRLQLLILILLHFKTPFEMIKHCWVVDQMHLVIILAVHVRRRCDDRMRPALGQLDLKEMVDANLDAFGRKLGIVSYLDELRVLLDIHFVICCAAITLLKP